MIDGYVVGEIIGRFLGLLIFIFGGAAIVDAIKNWWRKRKK